MKRVIVHIDQLVLKGFNRADRDGIVEGLHTELLSQFSDAGVLDRLTAESSRPRIRIGGVKIDQGMGSRDIGSRIGKGLGSGGGK